MIRILRLVVIAAVITAFGIVMSVPATASTAATPQMSAASVSMVPLSAQGCTHDDCIFLSNPSGGKVTVAGCAWKTTFYGHIQITGPNGLSRNSGTQTWHSTTQYCQGSDQHYSQTVSAVVGQYCTTAWEASGTNYGRACANVE